MKVTETKIYLRFISWFLLVALLPIVILISLIYLFSPDQSLLADPDLQKAVLVGTFVSMASVFLLSLIATRRLSLQVTLPISLSVQELAKVVDSLSRSVDDLSDIGQNNSEISQFLLTSSQSQQKGLRKGSKAVKEMVQSIDQINKHTSTSAKDILRVDKLAADSSDQSQAALDGLVVVKHLSTENQKLTEALGSYANDVKEIANRVKILADTAKFLSLNVSIEASKSSFSEEFSALVSQIRELNITSEQAANSIGSLASDMQRQIKQSRDSSIYEGEETNRSISVVAQTIKFLNKIVGKVAGLSKNMQTISKETDDTSQEADSIAQMIDNLNKESKGLVKRTDNIASIINKQLVVTRALNRSRDALNDVSDSLNNLVGRV